MKVSFRYLSGLLGRQDRAISLTGNIESGRIAVSDNDFLILSDVRRGKTMVTTDKRIWLGVGACFIAGFAGLLSKQFFYGGAFICIGCSQVLTALGAEANRRSTKYWLSLILAVVGSGIGLVGLFNYLSGH